MFAAYANREKPRNWLPPCQCDSESYLANLIEEADQDTTPLNPVLEEFRDVIENDSVLYMLFTLMFEEVPRKSPYYKDPTGRKQLRSYHHMLRVFNIIMTKGPPWMYTTAGQKGMVGFPFSAVLDWPMGTAAGTVAFVHSKVSEQFRNILNEWARYLASPDSLSVLSGDYDGWLSEQALEAMTKTASDGSSHPHQFETLFRCDPSKPHYGFSSWDDFFTRTFQPGIRPVAFPDDENVILNACESSPLRVTRHVRTRDEFWLKSQPYSLYDMLAGNENANTFTGGTVYQAFLDALSYHRWHSPINGTVVKIQHQPGTLYAESYWEGFGKSRKSPKFHQPLIKVRGPDPAGPNRSQAYISAVATRAMIYIQADNPAIGLICAVFIGMAEVSSCEFTVKDGARVMKGDEIGMFHYGGSSYCLLFQKGVNLDFVPETDPEFRKGSKVNVRVRSELATLR